MRSRASNGIAGFGLVATLGVISLAVFQAANTQYQSRGFYKEGTRTAPSTDVANLYLIAAQVDYDEAYSVLPSTFRASFYLPAGNLSGGQVFLTIRERKPVYFYWLDEVQPQGGWRAGRMNRFEWSTATVVRFLDYRKEDGPLSLGQLAATARLGRPTPGSVEHVAPVALYHSRPPEFADGYRFVFRPDKRMRLTFQIFREGGTSVLDTQGFPVVPAELPKEVRFSAKGWTDGWHRLAVTGYSSDGAVDVNVRFYHARLLAP